MKQLGKMFLCLFPIIYFCLMSYSSHKFPFKEILEKEKRINAELQFSIGSEKENEFFYNARSFAVDNDGYIYILDSGNSRIQCFSSDGQFCYSFGRYGQGPGGLSQRADRIKLLEDDNIYIIDYLQRRINVFSKRGEFQKLYKINFAVDDIVLKNKTYYLSHLYLAEKHKPIHFTDDLSEIENSFGESFEPTPGIIDKINSHPNFLPIIKNEFAHRRYTSIIINSKEEVIYSQQNPYRIVKYNKEGHKLKEVVGNVQFNTYFPLTISVVEGGFYKEVVLPFARIFGPMFLKDDSFVVPVIIPDESMLYLDVFNSEFEQTFRYRLSNIFYNNKKKEGIASIHIDKENNFYCLVVYEDDVSKLLKYKLILD